MLPKQFDLLALFDDLANSVLLSFRPEKQGSIAFKPPPPNAKIIQTRPDNPIKAQRPSLPLVTDLNRKSPFGSLPNRQIHSPNKVNLQSALKAINDQATLRKRSFPSYVVIRSRN